jgi:RNA polymerase sigma-70 factor (ECF subfamily)
VDPEAFDAIVAESAAVVIGFLAYRLGGDRALAEDLAQETYLAAYRSLLQGADVHLPLPWLLGIARHKWLDHLRFVRRKSPHPPCSLDAGMEIPVVDSGFDDCWRHDLLVATLGQLPPKQRVALTLRYSDGLPIAHIAAELGIGLKAVESLLDRGKKRLRSLLTEYGYDGR